MRKIIVALVAMIFTLSAGAGYTQVQLGDYSSDISSDDSSPSQALDDLYSRQSSFSQSTTSSIPSIPSSNIVGANESAAYFSNPLAPPSISSSSGPTVIYTDKKPLPTYYYNPNYVGTPGVNMFDQQATVNPYSSAGQTSIPAPSDAYASPQDITSP